MEALKLHANQMWTQFTSVVNAADGMRFKENKRFDWLIQPQVVFGLPLAYLVGVAVFARYMQNKKEMDISGIMRIYNVAQIVVCSWMVWGGLTSSRVSSRLLTPNVVVAASRSPSYSN